MAPLYEKPGPPGPGNRLCLLRFVAANKTPRDFTNSIYSLAASKLFWLQLNMTYLGLSAFHGNIFFISSTYPEYGKKFPELITSRLLPTSHPKHCNFLHIGGEGFLNNRDPNKVSNLPYN